MKEKYRKNKNRTKSPPTDTNSEFEVGGYYIATHSYTAITPTEHSFEAGAVFQVVEKHKEGWWKALCNDNKGFVHESFLKKTKNEIGSSPQYATGSAQLCDRIFPTDKSSMESSPEITKQVLPRWNELKIEKTEENAETLQTTEKTSARRSPKMDEQSSTDGEDLADKATLNSRHKVLAENGWIPQGLDEMNPKYKNKFLKANSAERVDKALLETSWKPQDLGNLNSKFKDNIMKKNEIVYEGKKNESPMKRFKKKITRSHRERSQSLTQLSTTNGLNPKNEETKKKIESSNNETSEAKELATRLECDSNEGGTRIVRQKLRDRSRTVATTNTVELETKDKLQTVNKEIASIDMKNISSRPELSMDEKSQKLKQEDVSPISFSSKSSRTNSSDEPEAKLFCAKFSYEACERGEISFYQGEVMEVIRKAQNGWWLVIIGQRKGWAPSNFLVPISLSRKPKNDVYMPITRNIGQQLQTYSSESELDRIGHQRRSQSSGSSSSTGSNPPKLPLPGASTFISEQSHMVPSEVFRDDSPINVMTDRSPNRFSPSNIVSPKLKGNYPQEIFFNSEPSHRKSPRSVVSETSDAYLSKGVSPCPKSSSLTRSQEIHRQLPLLPADTLNIKACAKASRYQCDPECVASHANDEQEILNVTSKDVVEVLYQDRRGYSLVRIPSRYGWMPTPCIKRLDSAS